MSVEIAPARWTRPARLRSAANDVALWLPVPLVVATALWRWQGVAVALVVGLIGAAALVILARHRAARFDRHWLIRAIDGARSDMEDSAGLLFADPATPIAALQRARLERRIATDPLPDLRPAWSTRRIAIGWGLATVAIVLLIAWPRPAPEAMLAPASEGGPVVPGVPRLVGQSLRIVPPAYTGLPPRTAPRLDVRAPVGSRLVWTLRFAPQPGAADLRFLDGTQVPLARGSVWTGSRILARSALYRVSPRGGSANTPLHRLDAVADSPPQVRVLAPAQSLTQHMPGQRRWALAFEATDDYAVAPTALLRITLAQGEGENVTFRERSVVVRGSGPPQRRRFAPSLDLAALGFAAGGDLIAQLIVRDTRAPDAQLVRSPSLILRWPSDQGPQAGGLEGAVKTALPAYFRSQRQIIIDAEALIKARRGLAPDAFVKRSDGIGVDQRLLRTRYGQFLGEEVEGGPKPPTNDAEDVAAHDDHDHPAPASRSFGDAGDVLADYGHTHDESEATTLLDPDTRATLKQALDQMWQSELHLRQGAPQLALPYAYKALRFIKQVQQATRIFLARVGPELPPIDATRRMTGKREGIASRTLAVIAREGTDGVPAAVWRSLADMPGAQSGADLRLDLLDRWVRGQGGRIDDPLALSAAIDGVRRAPDCAECRAKLRGLVWRALARPPAAVGRRGGGDADGRRYLDALGGR